MLTFAWIILILSIVGIVAIFASKFSGVIEKRGKGRLFVRAESLGAFIIRALKVGLRGIWHFILEAKDLTPPVKINQQVLKIKHAFKIPIRTSTLEPASMPEAAQLVSQGERSVESSYLEAINNNPNDNRAYEGLGRLYLQEKNFTDAIEVFRFLTKLHPGKDVYWSNLGSCLYSVKDFVGAIAAYEKSLNINSKVPARWLNLSLSFKMMEQDVKAIKALQNAINIDPRNLNYLMLLAELYIAVENKVRAEEVLERVLEIDPTNRVAGEKLMALKI